MEPTLSIPNRVLKRRSADDNIRATECENRSRPELGGFFYPLFVRLRSMSKDFKYSTTFLAKQPLFFIFCAGFAVMVLEIAVSRMLAPYFGSSIYVWGVILSVVLFSLSLGYYLGGIWADRYQPIKILYKITVLNGISSIGAGLFGSYFLSWIKDLADGLFVNLFFLPLISVIFLFSFPIILLGAISPILVKLELSQADTEKFGRISGRLSAANALGSIMGSLVAAFILIPFLGTKITIISSGLLIFATSFLFFKQKPWLLFALISVLIFLPSNINSPNQQNLIYSTESAYQHIVVKEIEGRLHLITEKGWGAQSVERYKNGLTGGYYDVLATIPFYLTSTNQRLEILVIGLGGGSLIKEYNQFLPEKFDDFQIDAVEIDPKIVKVARDYFKLRPDEANVYVADGSTYLRNTTQKYDLIVLDAFQNELYLPFHLSTKEFFSLLKQRLKPDGVLTMNVISTEQDYHSDPWLASLSTTLKEVFSETQILNFHSKRNEILLAGDNLPKFSSANCGDHQLCEITSKMWTMRSEEPQLKGLVLTDDRAPVQYLAHGFMVL